MAHHLGLSDFAVAAIPSLRKFKWGWAFDCHDPFVVSLVRGREQLEELDLSNAEGMGEYSPCSGLTDRLLIELGTSCPQLRALSLQGHLQLTSKVRARHSLPAQSLHSRARPSACYSRALAAVHTLPPLHARFARALARGLMRCSPAAPS